MADRKWTEGLEAENDTKNNREYNGKFHIIIGVTRLPATMNGKM